MNKIGSNFYVFLNVFYKYHTGQPQFFPEIAKNITENTSSVLSVMFL